MKTYWWVLGKSMFIKPWKSSVNHQEGNLLCEESPRNQIVKKKWQKQNSTANIPMKVTAI